MGIYEYNILYGFMCFHKSTKPTAAATVLTFTLLELTFRFDRAIRWSREFSASPGGRLPQTAMAILV